MALSAAGVKSVKGLVGAWQGPRRYGVEFRRHVYIKNLSLICRLLNASCPAKKIFGSRKLLNEAHKASGNITSHTKV